jgi:hypothetical protein
VVDAHDVDELEGAPDAVHPPGIAVLGVLGPAVQRVAPALARGAEEVGRHAGDDGRTAALVQLEQMLVGPHLGAEIGDEDRRVADDLHPLGVGIRLEACPLAIETPLPETPEEDAFGQALASGIQWGCLALGQAGLPVAPIGPSVLFAQAHEERVVGQPAGLVSLELREVGLLLGRARGPEAGGGLRQALHAEGMDDGEIDLLG